MTYCVGLRLDRGLVYMADTRTNAGVDNVSTFRKMRRPRRRLILARSEILARKGRSFTPVPAAALAPLIGNWGRAMRFVMLHDRGR